MKKDPRQIQAISCELEQMSAGLFPSLSAGERLSEEWVVYLEARATYPQFRGCCDWSDYLTYRLWERGRQLKQDRNHVLSMESRLSLDQPLPGGGAAVGSLFADRRGGFTEWIAFWDCLHRLPSLPRKVARCLCRGDDKVEIMAQMALSEESYLAIQAVLRQAFQDYAE